MVYSSAVRGLAGIFCSSDVRYSRCIVFWGDIRWLRKQSGGPDAATFSGPMMLPRPVPGALGDDSLLLES